MLRLSQEGSDQPSIFNRVEGYSYIDARGRAFFKGGGNVMTMTTGHIISWIERGAVSAVLARQRVDIFELKA